MTTKTIFPLFLVLFLTGSLAAQQRISPADTKLLLQKEDSLKVFSYNIVNSLGAASRFRYDSIFTRVLVRALKVKNSFYFPFDSCESVSRLYAPDSSFRIFTWQVDRDTNTFRQHGAIQMNTKDGSLKLFPLFDMSSFTDNPLDSVRGPKNWIGAIYYRMIMKEYAGRKYYTLLGYDDHTWRSRKKWIEMLSFNDKGEPVFGGPFFGFQNDSIKRPMQYRFAIEYKKLGNARLTFDEELDMIIYDHLISENNNPDLKYTYIPDGDYEGFKWLAGRWVHVDKVFDFKLKDGEFPMPDPLLNNNGDQDENKLMNRSEENKNKKPKKKGRSGN
jgi:hypothetical protein